MNMKMFKMIFNRGLRVKSRSTDQGSKMFNYLITRLAQMLGTQRTYYAASLYFELVRTSTSGNKNQEALDNLEKGRKILFDNYGGSDSASYIDFYLRKVELYVNIVMDNADA